MAGPYTYNGLIEELFIATDPATGLSEVWYRNRNVTVSLQVNQFLPADPESVRWAYNWKSSFVVRTGLNPQTYKFHVFNLIRSGLLPTATANYVRSENLATGLQLSILSGETRKHSASKDYKSFVATSVDRDYSPPSSGLCCVMTITDGPNLESMIESTSETRLTGSQNIQLSDWLQFVVIQEYGLDAYGDVIVVMVHGVQTLINLKGTKHVVTRSYNASTTADCRVSESVTDTAPTDTLTAASEQHLTIINNTKGTVLYRTYRDNPKLFVDTWESPGAGARFLHDRDVRSFFCTGLANWDLQRCAASGGAGTGTGKTLKVDLGTSESGEFAREDTIWGEVSFRQNYKHKYKATDTDSTVTYNEKIDRAFQIGACPAGNTVEWREQVALTSRVWTETTTGGYIYSVLRAWPVDLNLPYSFAVVVQRKRGTVVNDLGLFLLRAGQFTPLLDWWNILGSTSENITVWTGNALDLIWQFDVAGTAYLHSIPLNKKALLGVDPSASHYFRMLDFPRWLYRAAEPPGVLIKGWDAAGNPKSIAGLPHLDPNLDQYTTLAALDQLTPPVIPNAFSHDIILADLEFFNDTSGGTSLIESSLPLSPGTGDPVARAIILCAPSTRPAAFLALFPGRSDGAGGSPSKLDITASGRASENVFTGPEANYDADPVINFLTSAADPAPKLMLPQELQSTGDDVFGCVMQTGLQPAPGTDTHRLETVEPLLRRGPGSSGMPGLKQIKLAPVSSNVLAVQPGTVGTEIEIRYLGNPSPVKAVTGVLATGRFFGIKLVASCTDSFFQYLGALLRGRKM